MKLKPTKIGKDISRRVTAMQNMQARGASSWTGNAGFTGLVSKGKPASRRDGKAELDVRGQGVHGFNASPTNKWGKLTKSAVKRGGWGQ